MFRTTFQKDIFPIFTGAGLDPLKTWHVHRRDGYIKRIYDPETGILVMEMCALNVTLHYISTPKDLKKTLGIHLPICNFLIRNLNKCFSFEIKIMDDSRMRRRFRCGNFISCSSIQMFETTIPLTMAGNDWVLIYFNVAEFTRRCYNTSYVETERVQINGSIHLRNVFFSDRVIEYADLPKEYQLTLNEKKEKKQGKRKEPPARPPSPVKGKKGEEKVKKTASKSGSVTSFDVTASQTTSKMPGTPKSIVSGTEIYDQQADVNVAEAVSEAPTKIPSGEKVASEIPTKIPSGDKVAQVQEPLAVAVAEEAPPPADTAVAAAKQSSKEGIVEGVDNSTNQQEAAPTY